MTSDLIVISPSPLAPARPGGELSFRAIFPHIRFLTSQKTLERAYSCETRVLQKGRTEAADEWFKDNDPEGVVFGHEVIE
jgi:hypothetical protein